MSIATLFKFLVGDRDAILRIAKTPTAIWVGALFVLSAGLAREYDGADLVHEPWRLAIPFVASLGTSFFLYSLVYSATRRSAVEPRAFVSMYVSFLALYWMTAPLAWLYALPVERFLSAGAATRANLCLLGLVSLWRVSLMTQIVHVFFEIIAEAAFFLVMLFADTVAVMILHSVPIKILKLMGGIRLSESESLTLNVASWVLFAGLVSWFIWAVGACVVAMSRVPHSAQVPVETLPTTVERPVWWLAAVGIGVWALVLPYTQPEQQLRRAVESDLTENRIAEAIRLMSQHKREDFPPHWNPPPNLAFPNPPPSLSDVMEVLRDKSCAPWVRSVFQEKMESPPNGQ